MSEQTGRRHDGGIHVLFDDQDELLQLHFQWYEIVLQLENNKFIFLRRRKNQVVGLGMRRQIVLEDDLPEEARLPNSYQSCFMISEAVDFCK